MGNSIIGLIDASNNVTFIEPNYNTVVSLYTHRAKKWTAEQFQEFLSERLVNRDRRDIERILFRLGLSQYDVLRIAAHTRGIYKQRINPLTTDVEAEVAVYLLAKKLGVPCCPAYRIDKDTMFSRFLYNFSREYVVHFRRLFDGARSDNEYKNLVTVRPEYRDDFAKMLILDFITRQDDRHLSNMAIKVSGNGESFYPSK